MSMKYADDFNPLIEFCDYPVYLEDKILEKVTNGWASYTCYDKKTKQFIRHVYAVSTTKTYGCRMMEVRRDFENQPSIYRNMYYNSYGTASGCHPIWKSQYSWNYGTQEPSEKWEKLNDKYYYDRMPNYAHEINTVENIICEDLSLRYFGYQHQWECNVFDYIKLYRKYPIVETFMKLSLYRFIKSEKAIKVASENKAFRKWLYANADECKGKAFTTCYNAFKKNPDGSVQDYYNSLQYRIQCGYEIAARDKELYNYTLKFTTQEKLYSYLDDNNIGKNTYWDYIQACKWLRLDFNDTKVLYPKEFYKYHDLYTKQYGEYLAELEAEKNANKIKAMLKVAKKFSFLNYKNSAFVIVVANSKMDLIKEGEALHHCVGRMSYDNKQIEEQSCICFLRKAEDESKPFVTVELDLQNKKILQKYAVNNSRPDEEAINFLDNIWLPHVKKIWNKQLQATI